MNQHGLSSKERWMGKIDNSSAQSFFTFTIFYDRVDNINVHAVSLSFTDASQKDLCYIMDIHNRGLDTINWK